MGSAGALFEVQCFLTKGVGYLLELFLSFGAGDARPASGVWLHEAVPLAERHHPEHVRAASNPSPALFLLVAILTKTRSLLSPSPGSLDGVVMREPILMRNVPRLVTSWKSPIVIARHAHGDQYRATDFATHPSGGRLTLTFTPNDPAVPATERVVHDFDGPGVALAMYNTDKSIEGFARGSLAYARARGMPCVLGTKNTILKMYDCAFVTIFERVAREEFADVHFEHRLIDDLVAYMLKNENPVLYALKNYDGCVADALAPWTCKFIRLVAGTETD